MVIPGGRFEQAFERLASSGWHLNLQSALARGPDGKTASKTKFICPECAQAVWGKPATQVLCEPCGQRMLTKEQMAKALIMNPDAEDFASTTAH